MEYTTWVYRNPEFNFFIGKISNYYERDEETGDQQKGRVSFKSVRLTDEIFGAESRFYVMWEPKLAKDYHHGRAVQNSIKEWSGVEVNVERRDSGWINHHEYAIWYGRRNKFQQKRVYQIGIIHALFYCEETQRLIEFHGDTTLQFRDNYTPLIETAFKSLQCHSGQV
ncbi:MAG: hypothetical protein RBG13Loki_2503 [Promethearchaeota archaeon CR_4]|nr:MAG: hypothetical protein RBG13Loki_2503 [Candidatus Lokiarchaeota archaeon CR_4]